MINEQRVKLMTRLAAYEESEGKKNSSIGTYFKSDYIALQIMSAVVYATIAFGLVVGLVCLYDSEFLLTQIYKMDLVQTGKMIALYYFGFVGAYALLSLVIYSIRYRRAKKKLKVYFNNLKRLQILYQKERKDKSES